MENIKSLTISAKAVKNAEGKSFIACSVKIKGVWYKVKFTQEGANAPRKVGRYDIEVNANKCSVEKGKAYVDKKTQEERKSNDKIWIKELVSIHQWTDEELAEANSKYIDEIFGFASNDLKGCKL